jgi:hypothetical protein
VDKIYVNAKRELAKAVNFRTVDLKAKEQEYRDISGRNEKLEEKMIYNSSSYFQSAISSNVTLSSLPNIILNNIPSWLTT